MHSARRAAAVLLLFLLLTLVLAYPLSVAPSSRALPLSADTRLFLWTLSWDIHAVGHQPLGLFDANIFFPEPRTLAYSEHLLGSAAVGAPFLLATGNPLLALNAVVLLSCVLSGAGAFFLARRLGLGALGALAAGIVFAFAPPRFFRLAQLHVASVQWIPFCLGFLHAYLLEGRQRCLVAACGLFTLQALASGHGGLFLLLAIAALLAYAWTMGLLPPLGRLVRDTGVAGILLLAVNVAFLLPYLRVQREVGLHRTLGAVYDWSPNAASFIAAPTHAQRALLALVPSLEHQAEGARAYLFPGWLTLALSLLALVLVRRGNAAPTPATEPAPNRPVWVIALDLLILLAALLALAIRVGDGIEWTLAGATLTARGPSRALIALAVLLAARIALARRTPFVLARPMDAAANGWRRLVEPRGGLHVGFYLLLALLSLWASLGPGFGLYTALYRLGPGFDMIRVPSRLTILTLLGLAVLAGAGLERLLANAAERRRNVLGAATLALLLVEFAAFPLEAPRYPLELPAVDRWLAEQPRPFTIVELPVPDPADATRSARLHSHYMLHSMAHWQPMVNGYSGLVPPRHERLYRLLTTFPDEGSLRELESLGIRYAVLHREFYPGAEWERVRERAGAFGERLQLEHEEADGAVYSLASSPSRPTARFLD